MAGYRQKGEVELAWMESREQVTLQGRQILRRVLDQALLELDKEFNQALHEGQILDISRGKDDIKRLLLKTAQQELGNGSDG